MKKLTSRLFLATTGVIVLLIGGVAFLYVQHLSIFGGPYKLKSTLFTINLPGKPTIVTHSIGTADTPTIVTNYTADYTGYPSGQSARFVLTTMNNQGNVNQNGLHEVFNNSVDSNLNQNIYQSTLGILSETVISQSSGTYGGYPVINAQLKSGNGYIDEQERFVLVGNDIYWLKASWSSGDNNDFSIFANSLKFILGSTYSQH